MDLSHLHGQSRRRRWGLALTLVLGCPAALTGWHLWQNRDRGARVAPVSACVWQRDDPAPGVIHLRLQGQGYGLGLAQGQATRTEVQAMVRLLRDQILGGGLLGNGTRDWLLGTAWKLDAGLPPRFREELRGLADGAGVGYADLLLINTFDDLQHVAGCSSVVVAGREGRSLLHGRNLDYPIAALARVKLVRDLTCNGLRLRTVGFPGFIGALTGMSSRGLGLSSHTSASSRTGAGEPSGLLYRRLLEEGTSLEAIQQLLEQARRTMGNNLALSDARQNRALALEFDAKAVRGRPWVQGRLLVTNHFWDAELQRHQPEGWWAAGSGSQARIRCLAEALPWDRAVTATALQEALAQEGPGRAWRTPANRGTVQSVVMEPLTGRLWLAIGQSLPVTRGGYLELGPVW